jgi:glucose-1-phosphate adenylyltransferase
LPIYSLPHPSPRAGFGFDNGASSQPATDSLVASDCILSGATVRHSILFSRARIGDGSVVEDSLLLPNGVIGRNVTVRRAIVDNHCVLPDGIRIGVYPDQDRSRFMVSEKGVTLVTAAMLGQTMQAKA